jgi:hypothetical protein
MTSSVVCVCVYVLIVTRQRKETKLQPDRGQFKILGFQNTISNHIFKSI